MGTYLQLDYGSWLEVRERLSLEAVVVRVELSAEVLPLDLGTDLVARDFAWPRPRQGVMLVVFEPMDDCVQALPEEVRSKVVMSPKVVGDGIVPEGPTWRAPGLISPLSCPVCGKQRVRCLPSAEAKPYVDRYALEHGGKFGFRISQEHGDRRWQVDGRDIDGFRCDDCLSVCINGPHMDGEATAIVLEEQ